MAPANTVVSVIGFESHRIAGGELFVKELASQLADHGWRLVPCFLKLPTQLVSNFLDAPNVSLRAVEDCWKLDWKPVRQLSAILDEFRPRILHLNYTGFLSPYPWLARIDSVEKIFFTDHSSRPEGFVPRRAPAWKRALSRAANLPVASVICVSKYGYRCFTSTEMLPASRFVTIYNGVDLTRAAAGRGAGVAFRRRYSIPEDRLAVAQASWMIPEKGFGDLLEAARLVVAHEPKAHFVLAGDGSHLPEYRQMAERLGIAGQVTFTGELQDPLLEGLFDAAEIACQVSRWEEVFGFTIAEAMASRRPVLGTDVGGIPEVIDHGTTGFVVPRGDVHAMADRLLQLLHDPLLRERMGENGLRRAESLFNLKTNVAQLLQLYGIGER